MPPKSGRHHSPIVISSDSDEATRTVTPRVCLIIISSRRTPVLCSAFRFVGTRRDWIKSDLFLFFFLLQVDHPRDVSPHLAPLL